MRRLGIIAVCAVAIGATACGSDKPSKDPGPKNEGCDVDLSKFMAADGEGSKAKIRKVTSASDLIGGLAARGRPGDWILENDRIRVVIQGAREDVGPSPYGGAILDADLVRTGDGKDIVGKIVPFHSFGRTIQPESEDDFFVVEGANGAVALGVVGKDVVVPALRNDGTVNRSLAEGTLAINPEVDPKLKVTQYYVLAPGARRVRSITAFCNEGETPRVIAAGDAVIPGAATDHYAPGERGWQPGDGVFGAPWVAYQGAETAYAVVPGSKSASSVLVSQDGIDFTVQGAENLLPYTKVVDASLPPPGAVVVPAGGMGFYERSIVVGNSIGEVSQVVFSSRGSTGKLSGSVGGGFDGGAGARVLVTTMDGEPVTVLTADASRRFVGVLPPGNYLVSASLPGIISSDVEVEIKAGGEATAEVTLPEAGRLEVHINEFNPRDSDAVPVPGRSVIRCMNEACDARPDPAQEALYRQVQSFPQGPDDIVFIGTSTGAGPITVDLLPGRYDVVVSNGPEYEVAPVTFASNGRGLPKTIVAGRQEKITARNARIVDTAGWISADLQTRTFGSAGTRVSERDRLSGLMADGVEVLVSADRDTVTDFTATAKALDAKSWTAVLGGTEVATPGFDGIVAFPMRAERELPANGAIPWVAADGSFLAPPAIFETARSHGASLIQISGARGPRGLFNALKLDTATLATHADPESLGIVPPAGSSSSDTRLFSGEFDALAVLDGGPSSNFRALMNDWITFLGHGHMVTGTASSRSTGRLLPTAGSPRTWVWMGKDDDAPNQFDPDTFVEGIKAHRAQSGYGPFLHITARAGLRTAGIGETIVSNGDEIEIEVVSQSPEWMKYNRIEVYSYRPEAAAEDGVPNTSLPKAAIATEADGGAARRTFSVTSTAYNVDVVFKNPDVDNGDLTRVRNEVRIGGEDDRETPPLPVFKFKPTRDTFYIVVARTAAAPEEGLDLNEPVPATMWPVVFGEPGVEARPITIANPIFVDVDGNGWTAPAK